MSSDLHRIFESIGTLKASQEASHRRLDQVERDNKETLAAISADVKILVAEKNKRIGIMDAGAAENGDVNILCTGPR